jgi:hypothetical protein
LEWEVKKSLALPVLKHLCERVIQGEQISTVVRDLWLGLARKKLACAWWDALGEGDVVDAPVPDRVHLEATMKALIDQYGPVLVAVHDVRKIPELIALSRARLEWCSRPALAKFKRTKAALAERGADLWDQVGHVLGLGVDTERVLAAIPGAAVVRGGVVGGLEGPEAV